MASVFAAENAGYYDPNTVKHFPVAAGQTFLKGALVLYDNVTNFTLTECGADPALITGIALEAAAIGLEAGGSIHGGTNIPVFLLTPDVPMKLCSATTPAQAHVGNVYGVVNVSGVWKVDIADTTATRVYVDKISIVPEFFQVKFLAANLTGDAIAS